MLQPVLALSSAGWPVVAKHPAMAEHIPPAGNGLLASLTAMAATLVAIVHTRLDLLSTDLEEDRQYLLSLLVLSLLVLFFLGVGLLLATLLLVAFYWDTHRLLVLGTLAGGFITIGLCTFGFALHKMRTKPRLFTASLLELFKDHQQLDTHG